MSMQLILEVSVSDADVDADIMIQKPNTYIWRCASEVYKGIGSTDHAEINPLGHSRFTTMDDRKFDSTRLQRQVFSLTEKSYWRACLWSIRI